MKKIVCLRFYLKLNLKINVQTKQQFVKPCAFVAVSDRKCQVSGSALRMVSAATLAAAGFPVL